MLLQVGDERPLVCVKDGGYCLEVVCFFSVYYLLFGGVCLLPRCDVCGQKPVTFRG